MTAVYLLRHPQTIWNREERYQGRLESRLSPEGGRQAHLVARAFADAPLDVVCTSPLSRALTLARDVAHASHAPLLVDHRLTEIGQAPWEGLTVGVIKRRYPDLYRQWHSRPDQIRFPYGECLADVRARALSALEDVYRRFPQGNVAVVTHSVVVQVVAACCLGMDLRYLHRVPAANASITTLCGTSSPGHLLSLNVTDPLYGSAVASARAQNCVS